MSVATPAKAGLNPLDFLDGDELLDDTEREIREGTSEIHTLILGEAVTGERAIV